MDKKIIDELRKPIKVAFKPGPNGMKYKYVPGDDVINRLNSAFEYEWSSEVMSIFREENQVIAHVRLTANGVYKDGFGGSEVQVYSSGPKQGKPVDISNAYKSAVTNGIKKAAEQFGIGLTPDEDFTPEDHGSRGNTPTPAPAAPKPSFIPPVSNSISMKVVAPVAQQANQSPKTIGGVSMEELSKLVEKKMAENKAAEDKTENLGLKKDLVSTEPSPVFSAPAAAPSETPSMFPKSGLDTEKCSDVQVQALNGLVRMKRLSEIEAITKALPGCIKSSFKDLTMGEARTIIKVLQTPEEGMVNG